jgi:hypothetical protein
LRAARAFFSEAGSATTARDAVEAAFFGSTASGFCSFLAAVEGAGLAVAEGVDLGCASAAALGAAFGAAFGAAVDAAGDDAAAAEVAADGGTAATGVSALGLGGSGSWREAIIKL